MGSAKMESYSDSDSRLRVYPCDIILEAKPDVKEMSLLFSILDKNRGHSKKSVFLIMEQRNINFGSLPSITPKMREVIRDSGFCLSNVSRQTLINNFREKRKTLIISIYGEYILITKPDILSYLARKISRDLGKRNVIKRQIDFDIFISLVINNFTEEDDECKSKPEDELRFVEESNTKMPGQSTSISYADKNKNVNKVRILHRKRISTLSAVRARKNHEATLVSLEAEVYPNDSQKYHQPLSYGGSNENEKLSVQVTEMDAGQSSFEPAFGSESSRRLGSLYPDRPTTTLTTSGTGIRNFKRPRYSDFVEQQKRITSFHTPNWVANDKPDIDLLADCGFFYTGNQDLVRCHQCGIGLKDWMKEDDVLNEHVKYSSECDFLVRKLGLTQINRMKIALSNPDSQTARDATSSNAERLPYKIRTPRYQTMEARVASFKNFPQHIQISAKELAVSGLFYTENGDLCRCFTCDGGLKDWSTGDDPVKEHATYFPQCSYITHLKGREYVTAQQQNRSSNEPLGASGGSSTITQPTRTSSTNLSLDQLTIADNSYSSFHVSQIVQKCGYAELDVITAKAELERKGNRFPTADEIVNTILDLREVIEHPEFNAASNCRTDDVQSLVEENEKLSRLIYCMLCVTGEADILFLPCTHHRICHECAQGVDYCPVCNQFIKEKVKTFRS